MKTAFIQRVHAPEEVKNIVNHIVKHNNWILLIKKGDFNLNFYIYVGKRYK